MSNSTRWTFLGPLVATVVTILGLVPLTAAASTITVNTISDTSPSGDGLCSLREAMANARATADTTSGDCVAGDGSDTIVFSVSGTVSLSTRGAQYGPFLHWVSLPAVSSSAPGFLTIDGSGQSITINGNNMYLPLYVFPGATLHLNNITILNATGQLNGAGAAGAIESYGYLTVNNSTFINNSNGGTGNGVVNEDSFPSGSLTVSNSTFSGNQGWAILSGGPHPAVITNCTFSSNQNALIVIAPTTVSNSTFFSNIGAGQNQAGSIYVPNGGRLTISNSILADNNSTGNCQGSNNITNGGYNISDDASCGFGLGIGAAGQTLGDNISAMLDPNGLQSNGGPTQTIALETGSPAIDAIPSATCPATDQRGFGRPAPGHNACDVGAFEYNGTPPVAPPTITISSPTNTTYTFNQAVAASYSCTDTPQDPVTVCAGPVPSSSNIDTASAGAKIFTVNATDSYNNSDSASVNYSVAYNICPLYDATKAVKSGATIPLKLALCDVNLADKSASGTVVHATAVMAVSNNASETLQNAGNSNSDDNFRFDATLGTSGGYIFNLKTTGYATGTYNLLFTAGNDPTTHVAQFQVH